MAGKLNDEYIKWQLDIDQKPATKALGAWEHKIRETEQANKNLRVELTRMKAKGEENTDEFKRLSDQLSKNNQNIKLAKRNTEKLRKEVGLTGLTAKQLRQEYRKLKQQMDNVTYGTPQWKKLNKELGQVKNRMSQVNTGVKKTNSLFGNLKTLLPSIGFAGVAFGIKSLISNVISVRKEFEKYEAVLTNTMGSNKKARKELDMITKLASETPFQVGELTGAFIKLTNYGLKPTREEMIKYGDVAASVGKSFDQYVEAIADATQFEFERLKEFGIRAKKQGDTIKFTFKGVTTEVDATSEAVKDYMAGIGEMSGVQGSMAAISKTLEGRISNLGDAWDNLMNTIGKDNQGVLTDTVKLMTTLVKLTHNFWSDLKKGTDIIGSTIGNWITGDKYAYEGPSKSEINNIMKNSGFLDAAEEQQKKILNQWEKDWNMYKEKYKAAVERYGENSEEVEHYVKQAGNAYQVVKSMRKLINQKNKNEDNDNNNNNNKENKTETDKLKEQIKELEAKLQAALNGTDNQKMTVEDRLLMQNHARMNGWTNEDTGDSSAPWAFIPPEPDEENIEEDPEILRAMAQANYEQQIWEASYEGRLAAYQKMLDEGKIGEQQFHNLTIDLARKQMKQKVKQWTAVTSVVKNSFGEQTAAYKAAVIAEQVLALREQAIALGIIPIKIAEGQAKTAAAAPFPANIPLIAGFIAQVAGLIGTVKNAFKGDKLSDSQPVTVRQYASGKIPVRGNETGKTYTAGIGSGTGYYGNPALIPGLGLVGEEGGEMVFNANDTHRILKSPNLVRAINYTISAPQFASGNSEGYIGRSEQVDASNPVLENTLIGLQKILANGIRAKMVYSDFEDAQNEVNAIKQDVGG